MKDKNDQVNFLQGNVLSRCNYVTFFFFLFLFLQALGFKSDEPEIAVMKLVWLYLWSYIVFKLFINSS